MAPTGTDYREWIFAVGSVMVGCCSNLVFLELIVKESPDSGNLISFAQFLFVALLTLPEQLEVSRSHPGSPVPGLRLKKRKVPLLEWARIVGLFFLVNLLNNLVFQFRISMPFHIIFRSASLLVSLLFGIFYFKRSYALTQVSGVIFVTLGVILCTLAAAPGGSSPSSSSLSNSTSSSASPAVNETLSSSVGGEADDQLISWLIGVGLLLAGLVISCLLGMKQELVYKKYDKVPSEGMFYVHAMSTVPLLFLAQDLIAQLWVFSQSPPLELFGKEVAIFGITAPRLLVYLLGNVLTQ